MKKITFLLSTILFTVFINAQCNEPSNVQLINNYDYYIAWDANGASNWDIECIESGETPTEIPTIEDWSFSLISPAYFTNSIYIDLYIRADCGGSTSNWVGPLSFYNYCFDGEWLYSYSSESFDSGFLPSCWSEANQGNPTSGISGLNESLWEADDFANDPTNTLGARINITGTDVNEWLLFPLSKLDIPIKQDDGLQISFSIALTQADVTQPASLGSDDLIQFVISPDLGETWHTIYTWDSISTISNTGETFEFFYVDGSHGFYLIENVFLIAFWASSGVIDDTENIDFFIDSLSINIIGYGSIDDFSSKRFTFYPNPSKSFINLSAKENIDTVDLYNSFGQKVKHQTINNLSSQLDISDLPKGIYFMRVNIGDTTGVVPVIKE